MHDPDFVLGAVKRPWPELPRRRWRKGGVRWVLWSLPTMVTVWHKEPGDADAFSVCGRPGTGWRRWWWGWQHRRHLWLQVHAYQTFCRRVWTRCEECGKPFGRRDMVIGHQWGGEGPHWRRAERKVFHDKCSGLVRTRSQLAEARAALRALEVTQDQLTVAGMPWTPAWRVVYGLKDDWTAKHLPADFAQS